MNQHQVEQARLAAIRAETAKREKDAKDLKELQRELQKSLKALVKSKDDTRDIVRLEDLPNTAIFNTIREKIVYQLPLSDDELASLDAHTEVLAEMPFVKALNPLWKRRYAWMTLDDKKDLLFDR